MTLCSPLLVSLYLTMACSLLGQCHLLISLILLVIICDRRLYLQLVVASQRVALTSGPHLYLQCEQLIRDELAKLNVKELEKEEKLTRIFSPTGDPGVSIFFPKNKISLNNTLFSWKSMNLTAVEDVIIIGISEHGQALLDDYLPYGWMAGTFIAMKKVDSRLKTRDPTETLMVDYYGLVAYVRKDSKSNKDFAVEWDRWSLNVVNNYMQRDTALEAAQQFTLETFLCSYGSCSCASCNCKPPVQKKTTGGTAKTATSGTKPGKVSSYKNDTKGPSSPNKENGKYYGAAISTANSEGGRARATSISEGNSNAYSKAKSKRNNSIAESFSTLGRSSSYSDSFGASVAESSSGTGDATSLSKTKEGFAQSAAQSRGGGISAAAMNSGEPETEDKIDDGDSNVSEENEDGIDLESLIKDTNKAFSEASRRSEMQKAQIRNKGSGNDICLFEFEMEENLTLVEWKFLLRKANATVKLETMPEGHPEYKDPTFLYQSPLRYGIDVEVGANTSVLITAVISGYIAPRVSCCGLVLNPSSTIGQLLGRFAQTCIPNWQAQVTRLEKSFTYANVAKVMQTKKLAQTQLTDLVPLVLLQVYKSQTAHQSTPRIGAIFNRTTSDGINLIAAIILHAAHFGTDMGRLHKIKILKGLANNVRTVLTGIMLETKKCRTEPKLCSVMIVNRLKNEHRLILGLYLFLKFADSRFLIFTKMHPVTLFAEFVKLHNASIVLLAECKTRRAMLLAAAMKSSKN